MKSIQAVLQRFLKWLETVIPSVTAVGILIYNYKQRKVEKLERRLDKAKLELKFYENEKKIKALNKSKSASDVINDSINGRR